MSIKVSKGAKIRNQFEGDCTHNPVDWNNKSKFTCRIICTYKLSRVANSVYPDMMAYLNPHCYQKRIYTGLARG